MVKAVRSTSHCIMKTVCSVLMLVGAGLGTQACVAPEDADETVAEASSELFEDACRTATRDDITTLGTSSLSPDATYGHPGCPRQYVVGYGSFAGCAFANVYWGGGPLVTQSACQSAHLTLGAYTENNSGWMPTQTTTMRGVWQDGAGCTFATDSHPLGFILAGSKHRLAASAYQLSIPSPIYAPVAVEMHAAVCPPP